MSDKNKVPAGVIDCTPTWQGSLPYLFVVLEDGTPEGKRLAKEELKKMATAADAYNELLKETQRVTDFHHSEFEADLNNGTFQGGHYAYEIEKTMEQPEIFTLIIHTTTLSEIDGDEEGATWEYNYPDKEEAEEDIQTATRTHQMIYDPF